MFKKFTLALLILLMPGILFAAETQELATDYVTRIQNEISADIARLREAIETELADMKLGSSDINTRIAELEVLIEKSSDDMAAWGYTDEQRELHTRILSELHVAYSAYAALVGTSANACCRTGPLCWPMPSSCFSAACSSIG